MSERKPGRRAPPRSGAVPAGAGKAAGSAPQARTGLGPLLAGCGVVAVAVGLGVWLWPRASSPAGQATPNPAYVPKAKGALTFSKDVAPIVFRRCANCHRPDEAAPFSLLTYDQVRKRASQIAQVTARRFMPPWPPEPGYAEFADERRLSEEELGVLQQWVAEGAAQGDPRDLPRAPEWAAGWQLGTPDLTVQLPQPYALSAEGKDVYRNFVFPIPTTTKHYVKAVEFQPGNARVVHHAFIDIDQTRQSRRLAEKEDPPGFGGMELPDSATMPAGQFLGWQPGKAAYRVPEGLAWTLNPNTDLVLQMHMHPSGKPELVQPTVGFYFTDQAPTNLPFRLRLLDYEFDIPPGASNYVVEQSYVLPVDVDVLRVNPHAHYLGKDLQGFALLPDGRKEWLLWIKDWDFNWQGDYQYAHPISLPKGSKMVMRFTYDNSTNNVRNPNRPPKRVRHGINSEDEMAALGWQALARTPEDRQTLGADYQAWLARILVSAFQATLRAHPEDAATRVKLAWFFVFQGRQDEALEQVKAALLAKPDSDQAHYALGFWYLNRDRLDDAWQEFQTTLKLNPQDGQAYGNLGLVAMKQRRLREAAAFLREALRINPDDGVAKQNLELIRGAVQPP